MAEFYIDKSGTSEDTHTVHKATCGELPAGDSLFYIGFYASAEAAVKIAEGYFHKVGTCKDCLPA